MDPLDERLEARFAELLSLPAFHTSESGYVYGTGGVETMITWLLSAANLIGAATGRRGVHWEQAQSIVSDLKPNLSEKVIRTMEGALRATNEDRKRGLLGDLQYGIYAETFDDFLDIAADFHKSEKLTESAILASAVLEDTFKRIASKNGVDPNRTLEPLINDLAKQGILSPVQAKRAKAWAGVRTSAFHARWDELDLASVGEAISGIRGLIEAHLA